MTRIEVLLDSYVVPNVIIMHYYPSLLLQGKIRESGGMIFTTYLLVSLNQANQKTSSSYIPRIWGR